MTVKGIVYHFLVAEDEILCSKNVVDGKRGVVGTYKLIEGADASGYVALSSRVTHNVTRLNYPVRGSCGVKIEITGKNCGETVVLSADLFNI